VVLIGIFFSLVIQIQAANLGVITGKIKVRYLPIN